MDQVTLLSDPGSYAALDESACYIRVTHANRRVGVNPGPWSHTLWQDAGLHWRFGLPNDLLQHLPLCLAHQ